MDITALRYVPLDADTFWDRMMQAYLQAGGNVLYPGDEKYIIFRAAQAMGIQIAMAVDAALRMDTLEGAVREYLDTYAHKRNCYRIEATQAEAKVRITFKASGISKNIPAGTAITADGKMIYLLAEDVYQTGYAQQAVASIVCQENGVAGNGLAAGTQMQFVSSNAAVANMVTTEAAHGGQDQETDDAYRARTQAYGLTEVTTGPESQYERKAESVSSEILDAKAINIGPGKVGVYLNLTAEADGATIIQSVAKALSPEDERPLTDDVSVMLAKVKKYTLDVQYAQADGVNLAEALGTVVDEYQAWQDNENGRPFNPDKLMAMLYQAGATRVVWGEGSEFDGGNVAYTAIEKDTRCMGTITLAVMAT